MSICFWHPKFFGAVDLQSHLGFSFGSVQCIYFFLCDSLELFYTKNISSSKLHPRIWKDICLQLLSNKFCCSCGLRSSYTMGVVVGPVVLLSGTLGCRSQQACLACHKVSKHLRQTTREGLTPPPSCNKGRCLALRQGTGEGTAHGGWDAHPGEENDS